MQVWVNSNCFDFTAPPVMFSYHFNGQKPMGDVNACVNCVDWLITKSVQN